MLSQALRGHIDSNTLVQLLLSIPVILISLTIHEYCHGYAAYRCGDMTARNFGRLSLNPIKHLDPIGTIMMLVFGFGYAKPVPINPRNFKNVRRDLCIVSLAGPISNILLAFLWLMIFRISITGIVNTSNNALISSNLVQVWMLFCQIFISINLSLAVFNMIPIPPLDGSRLLSVILPAKISFKLAQYEQYIMLAVFALLWFGKLDGIISFCAEWVFKGMNILLDLIPVFYKIG